MKAVRVKRDQALMIIKTSTGVVWRGARSTVTREFLDEEVVIKFFAGIKGIGYG